MMRFQARLGPCVLLTYRTPATDVERLVPHGLELVRRGPYAFWNVVACRVEAMRPAGWPVWCGVTYHHVAYRLRVRTMTDDAAVLEGLYFARSDADDRVLCALGNRLSDFRFHPATITLAATDRSLALRVTGRGDSRAAAELAVRTGEPRRAPDSCFPTIADAAAFCTYVPLGLSVETTLTAHWARLAEVTRDATVWHEQPVTVDRARFAFFNATDPQARLEWATRLTPVDYRWTLGRRVKLRHPARVHPSSTRAAGFCLYLEVSVIDEAQNSHRQGHPRDVCTVIRL